MGGLDSGHNRPRRCIGSTGDKVGIRKILVKAFDVPVRACMVGLFLGVIPPLQALVYGEDTALEPFVAALECLGGAYVPCVFLVLGSSLRDSFRSRDTGGSGGGASSLADQDAMAKKPHHARLDSDRVALFLVLLVRLIVCPRDQNSPFTPTRES